MDEAYPFYAATVLPPRQAEVDRMIDGNVLQWLASQSETLQLRHNAHHDSHTTVARHLLHRERLGEKICFGSEQARIASIETQSLWELSVRHRDGEQTHLAAPTLAQCMALAQFVLGRSKDAIAA